MNNSRSIIVLILFTLGLSFAAVAFIINGALQIPSPRAIADLCAEKVSQSLPSPKECPVPALQEPSLSAVSPTLAYPGFSYPSAWQIIGNTAQFSETAYGFNFQIFNSSLYFSSCDHPVFCQKKSNPVVTISQNPLSPLLEGQTRDASLQERYASSQNVSIVKESLDTSRTRYIITGTDPLLGSFHHILITGTFSQVEVTYQPSALTPEDLLRVQALAASLNLSLLP